MEARGAFLYLAVSYRFVSLSLSMRAIWRRPTVDLVNLIRTPSSACLRLPAVTGLLLGGAFR